VGGWQALLAAIGGLILGLGVGVVWARRSKHVAMLGLRRVDARVRASLIPVLEAQAHALGLSREERSPEYEQALEEAIELATLIQRLQEQNDMAYSDTVELSRKDLSRRDRSGSAEAGPSRDADRRDTGRRKQGGS
jgi:hypothetical protein